MPSRTALSTTERQLRSRLRQLLDQAEGFLHGSPIELSRKCGKPTCRCATDESMRHCSLAIGQTRQGKTTMLHIPKSMEAQALRWIEDFKQAAALLEALDRQGRLRIDAAKAARKKAQTAPKNKADAGGKAGKKKTSKPRKARKRPS